MVFLWSAGDSAAQDTQQRAAEAYFRVLADHFEVPVEEVTVLGDWDLEADEVPVILFVSERAGVSPDALVGLRRRGRSWTEVAARFGLENRAFFLPMPADAPLGILDRAYGEYRTRPAREWNQISLGDAEIVFLVNLRVLSEEIGVPPLRVLQSRQTAGSFVACLAGIIGDSITG
jgi:hypothetical protein